MKTITGLMAGVLAVALLPAFGPLADEAAPSSYCDARLGADYDKLTPERKNVRLNDYFNCRLQRDYRRLKRGRAEMQADVNKWRDRADHIVSSTMRTKLMAIKEQLKVAHNTQRTEFNNKYANAFNALKAKEQSADPRELAKERKALVAERDAALKEMRTRQLSENRKLNEVGQQCGISTSSTLNALEAGDVTSINAQFQAKASYVNQRYSEWKNTPMDMSPNQYRAQQSTAAAAQQPAGPSGDGAANSGSGEPVGVVTEGKPTMNRTDQTIEAGPNTPAEMGDTVQTGQAGGCTIVFEDQSTMRMGEDSSVPVDEVPVNSGYEDEDEGWSLGKALKGLFIYTSELIHKKEPKDVKIYFGGGGGIRG